MGGAGGAKVQGDGLARCRRASRAPAHFGVVPPPPAGQRHRSRFQRGNPAHPSFVWWWSQGNTALHIAAYNGNHDVAKVLLQHGAEVDAQDNDVRGVEAGVGRESRAARGRRAV